MDLPVIAIYGPTSVGKTEVSLCLAKLLRQRGEDPVAISADAFAVYREMPIISAAPDETARGELDYRMVGDLSVAQESNIGVFAARAISEIESLLNSGRRVIVVGGSSLYMMALLRNMQISPPVTSEIRNSVQARIDSEGIETAYQRLIDLHPELATQIASQDARRVGRALELIDSGHPPVGSSDGIWNASLRWPTLLVGLTRDREQLRARIDNRVEQMVTNGAVAEAETVAAIGCSATASKAIGIAELLVGDYESMRVRTWQLARSQLVWMRKMQFDTVIDASSQSAKQVAILIVNQLDSQGLTWR